MNDTAGVGEFPDFSDIIKRAETVEPVFRDVLKRATYESAGMFNSELLMFISAVELCQGSKIIESGRARGYSTHIMAEYFKETDIDIVSIDPISEGEVDEIAQNKLQDYDNVEMKYGDSRNYINDEIKSNSVIIIDGPKGDSAIHMALEYLESDKVEFVAIHDLHKHIFQRDIAELIFNYRYFSDRPEFVDRFKSLDEPCWEFNKNKNWHEPHVHKGKEVESYGPTLGLFFNGDSPIDERRAKNYKKYYKDVVSLRGAIANEIRRRQKGQFSQKFGDYILKIGRKLLS